VSGEAKRTLYSHLVSSHLRIAALGGGFLITCFVLILIFQRGAARVANVRLPAAIASAGVENAVDASISELRSKVMLGRGTPGVDVDYWEQDILPGAERLQKLGAAESIPFDRLTTQLADLRDAQWHVHELSATIGNYPARQIYEQELLPIYDRIQRAIGGIEDKGMSVSSIRLSAALTHQQLSEAVRQLSEAVRTGSVAEVEDFRSGSLQVQQLLRKLARQVSAEHDSKPLLDWILREYSVYEQLANEIIRVRQSPDWNRALHLMRQEIEPLALKVKGTLAALRESHTNSLRADVGSNEQLTRMGGIASSLMALCLLFIAWRVARSRALWVAAPLESLASAAEGLADNPDQDLLIPASGPAEVRYLAQRFQSMSRQLIQRTRELLNANEDLQEYTHIVTHDLKPPLINIKGHLGLIERQLSTLEDSAQDAQLNDQDLRSQLLAVLKSEIPESMGYINLSVSQANTLIGGIQNNSKLLFRDVAAEEIDVTEIVDRVLALFSYQLVNVDLTRSELPTIHSDPLLIEHIFTNLIDNAIKYLEPSRRGEIGIYSVTRENVVEFSVRDNGIGLKSTGTDVFRKFERGVIEGQGTGMGLALTKTMVAKLGGDISYSPNAETGTTFSFRIPSSKVVPSSTTR